MGSHDGDNGIGEAALGELSGLHEMLHSGEVELAVPIDELDRANLLAHSPTALRRRQRTMTGRNRETEKERGKRRSKQLDLGALRKRRDVWGGEARRGEEGWKASNEGEPIPAAVVAVTDYI